MRSAWHATWAVAIFAVVGGFQIGADPWDPLSLERWGLGVLIASGVGLGLATRSWWAIAAALVLIPLAPLNRAEEPPLFYVFFVPVLVVGAALLIALGVGVGKPVGADRGRLAGAIGAGLLGAAALATLVGIYLDHRVVDDSPDKPLVIDDSTGAYRSVQVGTPVSRLDRLLGPKESGLRDVGDLDGPSSFEDWKQQDRPGLIVFHDKGRVRGYVITD